jgi:soluble lytic murein transglycosylase-like protein
MPSISALPGYRALPGLRAERSFSRVESRAFDPIIANVARRYNVEQALVKAVIKAESGFQPNAVSPRARVG